MNRPWWTAVGTLALLVTCVGLVTSRVGLVVHEFVGHGGATLAVGGDVLDVHLFAVAGGWIRYRVTQGGEQLIAMGGIIVETLIGLALWLSLARRSQTLGTRIVRGMGLALIVHASWYLATGTWHGYGDGTRLYRTLGETRWMVCLPAAAVGCLAAFAGARSVFGALAQLVPAPRSAGTVLALVVAGGVQLGAALTEVRLRSDAAYAQTMRPERDRIVARELAAWEKEQLARGAKADAEARARRQAELAAKNAVFPFMYVFAGMLLAAIIAGAVRARSLDGAPNTRALVTRFAIAACGSIAVVIAIDAAWG